MSNHIHILKMGGTIEFKDPHYGAINENLMKLDTTIDHYLQNLIKPHFTYTIESICDKDSREITKDDLILVAQKIIASPHTNILITHGTFTMTNTAAYIDNTLKKVTKKIILTGSMIPIVGFSVADAAFNIGFSIASFGSVKNGVYICMNGGIFPYTEVKKNTEIFRFE